MAVDAGVGVNVGLEAFVCAEAVAWNMGGSSEGVGRRGGVRTNNEKESFGWGFGAGRVRFHAMDDGRDEINVKDGVDVDEVKDDGNSEKA